MPRTASLTLVVGVLLALGAGGVATGASVPERATVPHSATVPEQERSEPAGTGREQVGTIEPVEEALGYLDADRSVTLHYPGAEYVKVHIGRLSLLPGDYLTVADPAGEEVYRYASDPLAGLESLIGPGGGWATSVTGDRAVVTLHRVLPDPPGPVDELAELGAAVDKVARGLRADELPEPAPSDRAESLCGSDQSRDAVCYRSSQPTIYRNSKAVARLLIDGIEMCTAFRVGPRNRLLTNHHCIESTRQAQRTEVWFNYQCASCGGWAVFRSTKVRGDQVLETHSTLDFTLFTVDSFAEVERFGYLELADRPARAGDELYIPQHPRGVPGRVALDSDRDRGGRCAVERARAHGYAFFTDVSYHCDTDSGSSGSPVLSRDDHRVIALHHFGGCPNSGVRMDLIRPRIDSRL